MLPLLGLAALAAAGVAGFEALYRARDRGTIRIDARRRTPWQEVAGRPGVRRFQCRVPCVNDNQRYEQTLVDVRPAVRVLARGEVSPRELIGRATVRALDGDGRGDGYWAASLIGPGGGSEIELTVEIDAPAETALHAAVVELAYETYGRGPLLAFTEEVVLPLAAVKPRPEPASGQAVDIQCVPTHILTDLDDIVDVIDRYTRDFRRDGDVVAVAESVVAITQHRYFRPQEIRPGFWASRLCYFIPSKGSLSSRHGFQTAMNEVGAARMVASLFVGALGKALGQNGWFYSLAGRPAELIDDITGTMPPFDKYIVAGPHDPEAVVARIRERTGMHAAIVDANDLKRAMVLAATPGLDPESVSRWLLDNPFGNAAEQTPIVVLRPHAATEKEEAHRDPIRTV